jgi:hypothetical protein
MLRLARDDEVDPWVCFEELIEAHLDTIEIGLADGGEDWADHVRYLQGLVRQAHAVTARRVSRTT